MSHAESFPHDDFIVEYHPEQNRGVACMDRRRLLVAGRIFGNQFFQQLAGSRSGIGDMTATSLEVDAPGSFTDLSISTAQFSQGLGASLQKRGIITMEHGVCGAINGATAIRRGITAGPDYTKYRFSQRFMPDITTGEYEQVIEAEQRIELAKLGSGPDDIKAAFHGDVKPQTLSIFGNNAIYPVPFADLDPGVFNDNTWMVADYRPNIAYDQDAATKRETSVYYTTAAAWGPVLEAASDVIDSPNLRTANAVMAVRLGEIASAHIMHEANDGTRTPYPIVTIGYNG